jgi:hypothetical protein
MVKTKNMLQLKTASRNSKRRNLKFKGPKDNSLSIKQVIKITGFNGSCKEFIEILKKRKIVKKDNSHYLIYAQKGEITGSKLSEVINNPQSIGTEIRIPWQGLFRMHKIVREELIKLDTCNS